MRCRQGDLAYVVVAMNESNIGKIVHVHSYIGFYTQNELFEYKGQQCGAPVTDNYWWVEAQGIPLETNHGEISRAYIPDTWLRPIPSDFLDDDT